MEGQKPTIGRIVTYRSKTGDYDVPAVVNCTVDTLSPKGVEPGHVPALSSDQHVHLTLFTPGKQGTARPGNAVNNAAAGGTYQEFDIPPATSQENPEPGDWRWPVRIEG
jgi:hypothetical protein